MRRLRGNCIGKMNPLLSLRNNCIRNSNSNLSNLFIFSRNDVGCSRTTTTARSFSVLMPKYANAAKYPPIKPNPQRSQLSNYDRLPRPSMLSAQEKRAAAAGYSSPLLPAAGSSTRTHEETSRLVTRKVIGAMALFFGCLVLHQIYTPQGIKAETRPGELDEKRIVVVKEATVGGSQVDTVESGTSHVGPLPKRIFLPAKGELELASSQPKILEEYTLVGHGIRTVSFLSIQVYVVALYVATSSIPQVQRAMLESIDVPGSATTATLPERRELKRKLGDENDGAHFFNNLMNLSSSPPKTNVVVLGPASSGVKMAIRIVPTRSTDFGHLRDGWIRGINAKTKLKPSDYDDENFTNALAQFKTLFGGKKSVPKGGVILLARGEDGGLTAYGPDGKNVGKSLAEGAKKEEAMNGLMRLGHVSDERLSRALWFCYVAGAKVASEGARRNIVDGLVELTERPVGSTEGKVV